ncbi:MAG: hypothetical protein JW723_15275 [Bacteroidales bacterium]|nr:hypothetical protein [Bacteroidales bacterium]
MDLYHDTIVSQKLLKIWVDNLGTVSSLFFLVNPDGYVYYNMVDSQFSGNQPGNHRVCPLRVDQI